MHQQFHVAHQVPVAFYVKEVRNALLEVHDNHCGPFPTLMHDIGHAFWGSLLTHVERNIINHDLIPYFEKFKTQLNTEAAAKVVDQINHMLTDYDLTPIMNFGVKHTRFVKYVMRAVYHLS